jgi:hypothetical protein
MDPPDLALERLARRRRPSLIRQVRQIHRQRRDRERPDDLGREPRCRGTPARTKIREGSGHGRCRHRHGLRLEQMF